MSIITSQQISKYYELYKAIDVTFTKEVIKITGLDAPHVYLKCIGEQWPCVVYSTSFTQAKIIASARPAFMEALKKANNMASLRFSFKREGKAENLAFFIGSKILGFSPYSGGQDLQFITLSYTQRPPDDLIEILGKLLEANINSTRRRDERILLTPDTIRKLGFMSKESMLYVQGVPRRCILRDISFSGAKIILVGLAKFLVQKECSLRIELDEPREVVDIKGKSVRFEEVEGRKDLIALAIAFDESVVPMSFKIHINEYLTLIRKNMLDQSSQNVAAAKGSAKANPAAAGIPIAPGATPADGQRARDAGSEDPVASLKTESFTLPEEA
jgi:hypothetical protein